MDIVQKYADLGIKIKTWNDKHINDVFLNIPKKKLAEALDRDGDILPVCCAAISEIRDILSEVAKNGGWLRIDELKELVRLMKSHDHGLFGIIELYEKIDPEDCRKEFILTTDAEKLDDALNIMENASRYIKAVEIFTMDEIKSCYLKSFHAARILKAIETVYQNIDKLHPPTARQAYAVCMNGEIIGRQTNVMVFAEQSEADDMAKEFRRSKETISVRHIEFDANGIRFLT